MPISGKGQKNTGGQHSTVSHNEAKDGECQVARTVSQFMSIVEDGTFSRFRMRNGERNAPRQGYETLCYRGQSNDGHCLTPSITRAQGRAYSVNIPETLRSEYDEFKKTGHNLLSSERRLIDYARTKMPETFRDDMPPVEFLAAMQHYGLPTRLLDVTDSPMVALYFACCAEFGREDGHDGLVTVFRRNIECSPLPVINAFADTYRFMDAEFVRLDEFYRQASAQPYYVMQRQRDLECFDGKEHACSRYLYDCCRDGLIFVYPPNRFMRQVKQQCGFILFPNKIALSDGADFRECGAADDANPGKCGFLNDIEPIPGNHGQICVQIRIPRESKPEILRELSLMGMNKKEVYSDSPDIVCEEIKFDIYDLDFLEKHLPRG